MDHITGLTTVSTLVGGGGGGGKTYCKNCLFSLKYLRYAVRTISHDILLNIVFTDAYFSGKPIFLKTVNSQDKAS